MTYDYHAAALAGSVGLGAIGFGLICVNPYFRDTRLNGWTIACVLLAVGLTGWWG